MEKEGVIYICMYMHTHTHIYNIMEYYSASKKNKLLLFAAPWMDLETVRLSEVSQTGKDKYMILLLCGFF